MPAAIKTAQMALIPIAIQMLVLWRSSFLKKPTQVSARTAKPTMKSNEGLL